MADKLRVGFIGVGLMGHGAAKNILERGAYPLTIIGNRNREPVDDLVGPREEHRVQPAIVGVEPTVHRGVDHRRRRVGDQNATVLDVAVNGGGDVAVAQLREGGLFPTLVLATVDGEFGDAASVGGGVGEPATGTDLGKLTMVTDQQHPSTASELLGDDGFEDADVGHPRFVDDQQ